MEERRPRRGLEQFSEVARLRAQPRRPARPPRGARRRGSSHPATSRNDAVASPSSRANDTGSVSRHWSARIRVRTNSPPGSNRSRPLRMTGYGPVSGRGPRRRGPPGSTGSPAIGADARLRRVGRPARASPPAGARRSPASATSVTGASSSWAASTAAIRSDSRISTGSPWRARARASGERRSSRSCPAAPSPLRAAGEAAAAARRARRGPLVVLQREPDPPRLGDELHAAAGQPRGGRGDAGREREAPPVDELEPGRDPLLLDVGGALGRAAIGPRSWRQVLAFPPSSSGRCRVRMASRVPRGPPNADPVIGQRDLPATAGAPPARR